MSVYETDIPGVGRKFELELGGGKRVVVVVHHDGRCELYRRDSEEADSEKILDLSGEQASRLGSILEGAYFEAVSVDELTVPLGDAIIEWVEVTEASPLAGETIGASEIRSRTGASIIAVQRGDETIPNPDPGHELRPDDLLVSVGTREELTTLQSVIEGTD